ncbi:MAG: MBL fold metallo-hydrolase [Dehalococcoidia bacterium]|nr:MAG: MBL fold metallo-hydrolase [Dehalococcoidia bacterium]
MPATHRLGNLYLRVLTDGRYFQDAGAVFGIVPKVMWERLGIELNERHQMALGLNSLLLSSQGKTILIETGVGDKERPRAQSTPLEQGNLLDELRAAGVAPEDVDVVINTHLHADHCGWNTRRAADGAYAPTFPRARYLIQRGEWDAATHPNERTRATYLAENLRPLADAGCLELIDGETRVTDEVTIVPTHGHTADHASVVLASGGDKAIYLGDMVQHPVQLERAAWVSSFDIYPLEAMETKKAVVARAIAERQLVVAVHCDFPGLGYMTETDDGKRKWTPVEANGGD